LDFIGGECPVEYQSYRTVPIGDFCINRKNSAWSFSDRTEKVKFESGENDSHFSARLEMQAPHDAMHRVAWAHQTANKAIGQKCEKPWATFGFAARASKS